MVTPVALLLVLVSAGMLFEVSENRLTKRVTELEREKAGAEYLLAECRASYPHVTSADRREDSCVLMCPEPAKPGEWCVPACCIDERWNAVPWAWLGPFGYAVEASPAELARRVGGVR